MNVNRLLFKTHLLFQSLGRGEFLTRCKMIIEPKLEKIIRNRYPYNSQAKSFSELTAILYDIFTVKDVNPRLEEELVKVEAELGPRLEALYLREDLPWSARHNADPTLARLCYLLTRMLQPEIIVETGVAYGVTSFYLLSALMKNGRGILYSIDLPPLCKNSEAYVGILVPSSLRTQWRLMIGPSERLLPQVCAEVKCIDIFVHDSLHTYRHMMFEFSSVLSCLKGTYAVLADDIEGHGAWFDFTKRLGPQFQAVVKHSYKDGLCGIALSRSDKN